MGSRLRRPFLGQLSQMGLPIRRFPSNNCLKDQMPTRPQSKLVRRRALSTIDWSAFFDVQDASIKLRDRGPGRIRPLIDIKQKEYHESLEDYGWDGVGISVRLLRNTTRSWSFCNTVCASSVFKVARKRISSSRSGRRAVAGKAAQVSSQILSYS
jgi:hypothetical protein